ncbi:MAG: DNA helicase RecQ, partial [Clostridia bacterium]
MTAREILSKYYGYNEFREGQEEIISCILSGQDAFGIMPTGAGKSICYQAPAMLFSGITIVISPLISLMRDQVLALKEVGIPAAYINSSLSPTQIDTALYNARCGKYKIIYVAPERLLTAQFLNFAAAIEISMLTVDEAHCISQWGQDFRPSYSEIPKFIAALKRRPIVSAFTATATINVKEDILRLLNLKNPKVIVTGFDRKNLFFEVQSPKKKTDALLEFLKKYKNESGIVYCTSRKSVEEVCETLQKKGYLATRYHAGLDAFERKENQDDFINDRKKIIVATNAFGMGIDKSNVAFVVHYNMPKDLESYYQEAGRAGRDGSDAKCLLFFSGQDVRTIKWMIENNEDLSENVEPKLREELKAKEYERLKIMTFYATTNSCLRAYILRYFGEDAPDFCGSCGNCNTSFDNVDVTEESKKIISCIQQLNFSLGATMVIAILKGSRNERIKSMELNRLACYNTSKKSDADLKLIISHLIQSGYISQADGKYPTLQLTEKSEDLIDGKCQVVMKLSQKRAVAESSKKNVLYTGNDLFTRLRELRLRVASENKVPSYVVFSDKTLAEMCEKMPKNKADMLEISGIGETRMERFGEKFLAVIKEYQGENSEQESVVMQENID